MEWLAKDGLTVRWCLYVAVVGWLGVYPANAAAQVRPPVTTSGGKLVIPPPTRTIVVADLAGEWGITEGINTTYVDRYTGVYAGTDSLHFTEKWILTANGTISSDFFGIQNGRKIAEKSTGVVTLSSAGILIIKMKNEQKYVLRGWLEGPNMTVMKLNGPWYGEIPADVLSNPEKGWNLDKIWVRQASPDAGAKPAPVASGDGKSVTPTSVRTIAVADLAGEWGRNDGINTRYVDRATGVYAGADSNHSREKWVITAQGTISTDYFGIVNGRKIVEELKGVVSFPAAGILVIKINGNGRKYVVRGWQQAPNMTVMTLNGPWPEEIPADVLSNPEQGANLDQKWVRLVEPK